MAALVELRGLRKRFGPREALRGVDLRVERPQILGVVGPDGAGKTTLLRTLAGLLDVEAEVARVLDVDLMGDVTSLKQRTGYVPQAFSLHRDLSVGENLRFTARLHRLPEDTFAARSRDLLARTSLTAFVDRQAGALSGGMKQKLAIANALLPDPALIILDEPTAGVDVLARREIWAMLREVGDALVVVSTSYLDEAAAVDHLIYLDEGRVIAAGAPDALRASLPLRQFRLWADAPREVARLARDLPDVVGVRAVGPFARVDVRSDATHRADALVQRLAALPGVHFTEEAHVDMESMLLAFAEGTTA